MRFGLRPVPRKLWSSHLRNLCVAKFNAQGGDGVERWKRVWNWTTGVAFLVSALASGFDVPQAWAAQPSFDCSKASTSDEIAICSSDQLPELDNLIASGFDFARSRIGNAKARTIAAQLLGQRRTCGNDKTCIFKRQIDSIHTFQQLGAPITLPNWTSAGLSENTKTLAQVKFDGENPATLQYQDLTVTLDSAPNPAGEGRVPIATGFYQGHKVFSLQTNKDHYGQEKPSAEVRLMWLDHSASAPQVVLDYFWGGAHCCEVTTVDTSGSWHAVDGEVLDGEGYIFVELDGDNNSELVRVDNSFLYTFDSYAG